jgi:hypothetical protein
MTRPLLYTEDYESSDSEREDHCRAKSNRVGYRAYSSTKTWTQRIQKRPRDGGLWRSDHLAWNILDAEDTEGVLSNRNEIAAESSVTYRSSSEGARCGSERELPLSHPKSWVWERKKNLNLAVVIDATRGSSKGALTSQKPSSKSVSVIGATYRNCQNPDRTIWSDKAESTYRICFLRG